jgi:hypothetical protein
MEETLSELEAEKEVLQDELKSLKLQEAEALKEKQLKDDIAQLKKDILKIKRELER